MHFDAFLIYEHPELLVPGSIEFLAYDVDDAYEQAVHISRTAIVQPLCIDYGIIKAYAATYDWCGGPRMIEVESTSREQAHRLLREIEHIATCCIPNAYQT
jgi:hypothetical protein